MKFAMGNWKLVLAVVAVAAVAVLAAQPAQASNMGFKMNKAIAGIGNGFIGTNLVALPFKSPYANGQDICNALTLTAGSGRVTQIDAQSGATLSHLCGDANPFVLRQREGLIVTNPTGTGGILVGSHTPGISVNTYALGSGVIGTNLVAVVYHTTAGTMQDICNEAGLTPGVARVTRIDAATGTNPSHLCGDANPPTLVLGEAVILTDNVAHTWVPSHF